MIYSSNLCSLILKLEIAQMLTWIKGFVFGLIMIVLATMIALVTNVAIEVMKGDGVMISLFFTILVVWSMAVMLLIILEKNPHTATTHSLYTRVALYWTPITLGWVTASHFYAFAFWIGLIISSTFVGYQVIVTRMKKKKQWRAFNEN